MRKSSRGYVAGAALAALALLAAACSSGGSTSSTSTPSGPTVAGWQGVNPGSGTPQDGRHAEHARPGRRGLHGLQHQLLHDRLPGPAAVGARPVRISGHPGRQRPRSPTRTWPPRRPRSATAARPYTVTIRTGAMWNTSPPRQVTAADAVLGLKRSCNPVQPFGGLPDFETPDRRLPGLLHRLRQARRERDPGRHEELHRPALDLRRDGLRPDHHLQPGPPGVVLRGPADAWTPFNPAPVESLNYVPAQRRRRSST